MCARTRKYVRVHPFCEYGKSEYFPAYIKGVFCSGGRGGVISLTCVRPLVGNKQLPIPYALSMDILKQVVGLSKELLDKMYIV